MAERMPAEGARAVHFLRIRSDLVVVEGVQIRTNRIAKPPGPVVHPRGPLFEVWCAESGAAAVADRVTCT